MNRTNRVRDKQKAGWENVWCNAIDPSIVARALTTKCAANKARPEGEKIKQQIYEKWNILEVFVWRGVFPG